MRGLKLAVRGAFSLCFTGFLAGACLAASGAGAVSAFADDEGASSAMLNWDGAIAQFAEAERHSPMVFDITAASLCRARWALHADMVDDGAFPKAATDVFTQQLRLPAAMNGVEFFRIEQRDIVIYERAYGEAQRLLAHALMGDELAANIYFSDLGHCSKAPEVIRDEPDKEPTGAEMDAPADG